MDLRGVGLNSIIYLLGDFAVRGVTFLLIPVYTRLLSPEEYGNWGILLSLISLFGILFSLQLNSSLTVNYFQLQEDRQRELVSVALIMTFVWASFMFVSSLFLRKEFVGMIFQGMNISEFRLAVAISFFVAIVSIPQTLMRLRSKAAFLVSVNIACYGVGIFLGIVLLIRFEMGVSGLLIGLLITNAFAFIPLALGMRRDLRVRFSTSIALGTLTLSLPIAVHMMAHWGLNLMDRIVLQAYLPLAQVGVYQLGYQFGAIFQLIVIAINNAWTPFFMASLSQPERQEDVRQLSTWLVFVLVWLALVVALFLPILMKWFVPMDYFASANVIVWIVSGFLFVGFYQFWVNLVLYHRRTLEIAGITVFAAFSNLVLNLITVPRYGYIAAAVNTMIAYMLLAVMTYGLASRIHPFPFEYRRWIACASAGLILYIAATVIGRGGIEALILASAGAIIGYPMLLTCFSFWRENEKRIFNSWIERVFG